MCIEYLERTYVFFLMLGKVTPYANIQHDKLKYLFINNAERYPKIYHTVFFV